MWAAITYGLSYSNLRLTVRRNLRAVRLRCCDAICSWCFLQNTTYCAICGKRGWRALLASPNRTAKDAPCQSAASTKSRKTPQKAPPADKKLPNTEKSSDFYKYSIVFTACLSYNIILLSMYLPHIAQNVVLIRSGGAVRAAAFLLARSGQYRCVSFRCCCVREYRQAAQYP